MPAPFEPATVTVTDLFQAVDGTPLAGRVTFTPSVTAKTPDATLARVPIVCRLEAGALNAVLVATDAPSVTPSGWTYDVVESLGLPGSDGALGVDAWVQNRYSISLPAANPAVVLSSLVKVEPVRESQFQVRTVAGVPAGLDGNVPLTASDLDAAGGGYASQEELDALTVRTVTLEDHPPNHAARHAAGGPDALTGYLLASQLGQPSGPAALDGSGLLPTSVLPALSITDVFQVSSEAGMLGIAGQRGDVAVRTDINAAFILSAEPASTLANWVRLLTPPDAVLSVAGRTGVVVLTKADVGLSNVDNTSDAAKPVSTAQAASIATKLNSSEKGAPSGVATLDSGSKLTAAQLPVHGHTLSQITDADPESTDWLMYGDVFSSHRRETCSRNEPISNGVLTIDAALTHRAFTFNKLRLCVVGAGVGGSGTFDVKAYVGTQSAMNEVGGWFGAANVTAVGMKEFTLPAPVAVTAGQYVGFAIVTTGWTTAPQFSSTTTGANFSQLVNAISRSIYKTGQTYPCPVTISLNDGTFTRASQSFWFGCL